MISFLRLLGYPVGGLRRNEFAQAKPETVLEFSKCMAGYLSFLTVSLTTVLPVVKKAIMLGGVKGLTFDLILVLFIQTWQLKGEGRKILFFHLSSDICLVLVVARTENNRRNHNSSQNRTLVILK